MEISLEEIFDLVKTEDKYPVEIGKAYLFRTVTHIELGRVKSICGKFATLSDASWIADTGRYHNLLKTGEFSESAEIEPYTYASTVNIDSCVNFAEWPFDLPRNQK